MNIFIDIQLPPALDRYTASTKFPSPAALQVSVSLGVATRAAPIVCCAGGASGADQREQKMAF